MPRDLIQPLQLSPPTTLPRTTELGLAEHFIWAHAEDFRYAKGLGWLLWAVQRWRPDDTGTVIDRLKTTVTDLYRELQNIDDLQEQKAFLSFIRRSEKRAALDAVAWLASSDPLVRVRAEDFDKDPWSFNVENGTLSLRTGKLRLHRRGDLLTKLSPVAYDPAAECPKFKTFLAEIMCGNDQLVEWLQRFLGMCLTGIITEQLFPIFFGCGMNGKNVLLDTVKHVMGPYAGDAPPSLVINQHHNEHPTEIAGLAGLRLVVASETEDGQALRLQLVKRMTGDLTLKGRYMRQDYFEFQREFKLILLTNNKPVIHENTVAAWRRLRLIPFDYTVPDELVDKNLTTTLRSEAPGILRWLVEGCMAWQRHGLPNVPEIEAATAAYRADSDVFGSFLDERCSEHPNARVSRASIWAVYSGWAEANKERHPLSKNALFDRLRGMGYEDKDYKEHGKSVRGFARIGLLNECDHGN